MRRITYVTGTRADFGLMERTLQIIHGRPDLALSLLATGMHLSPTHGHTVDAIAAAGLPLAVRVEVPLEPATGATMARNIGHMIGAFTSLFEADRPDLILLLGDRGEMLAGAVAAIHLNIPVAHIHGGERSGTVDEPVRHAISKLSHIHLVATAEARERLIRMGEASEHIHVTGAPGLDGLIEQVRGDRGATLAGYGFDAAAPFILLVFHPVLQEADHAEAAARVLLDAAIGEGRQVLVLAPNADAGSDGVLRALKAAHGRPGLVIRQHLARPDFITAMAHADLMMGNSSAGIIEASSFGTPVLNVGVRQNLREHNANVTDVPVEPTAVAAAIERMLAQGRYPLANLYGDGHAGERIADILASVSIDASLLSKANRN